MIASARILADANSDTFRFIGDSIIWSVIVLVAIFTGIARLVWMIKRGRRIGFTQRKRYENEVRRRQEIADRLAQAAPQAPAVAEAEAPPSS